MIEEENCEVPEDIGLKIGTKEEAFWNKVRIDSETAIERIDHEKEIQKVVLEYAKTKIAEEEKKSYVKGKA